MSRDALIVGISTYQILPGLNTPAQDAEAIAQRLQTEGEFRVTRMPEIIQLGQPKVGLKTQVSLAELETALVRLFKPKGKTIPETALFYFSGHGLQKDAGIQEGYLATSDANPAANFYGLSLFWLRRLLQESPVRQRILLLDCCHSGELLNFLEADPGARAGTDRLFMAASREYEAAYESLTGQYSVFTQALLDGLDPQRSPNGCISNYALTDWVSTALKSEQQQPLFENSGSEIILTRNQGCTTAIKTQLMQGVCPYRGLEFFDEAHAEYFFGREDLTDQLIEKLQTRNVVAVVGASGSGKSSLVRAGLIYRLRQGQKFSGSDRWRIQLITPTEQPLRSLATAFVNSQAPTVDRAEHLKRAELLLQEGENGLSHLVRASLISSKHGRNSRLLLVIDQFEEVFTLCAAERDRLRFFNLLSTALREVGDCLSIVLVLRADFFSKCSLYNGLAELIEQHLVTVTPLTYEQIKASIVKPAEKAGLVCDPNLVYNILLDVVGAPGELPLLQYTLLELWHQRQPAPQGGSERLTLDTYNQLGGVRGTLQKRADEIFYSLTPEEQQVAKRIFIALTQLGDGTEDTRRRILKAELVSPRVPAELVDRVVEKLVYAKLIVTNQVAVQNRPSESFDQELANVSTALRFAQILRNKVPQQSLSQDVSRLIEEFPTTRSKEYQPGLNSVAQLIYQNSAAQSATPYQETVDVAHEALIRNWSSLRNWLDENREMLRRQRRIEHAAREWNCAAQPRSTDYLLHGSRLVDAEEFLQTYPDELSNLAQRYIAVSQERNYRAQRELRLVQLAVPCTLLAALAVNFSQYWAALQTQAEKEYQLQIATSRQRAAIAQTILQEPDSDPTTALLISRLAAEKGGHTDEAQASLRNALQKLQLQANLSGHEGSVRQVAFNPNNRQVATASEDGTVRLWSLTTYGLERVVEWQEEEKAEGREQKAEGERESGRAGERVEDRERSGGEGEGEGEGGREKSGRRVGGGEFCHPRHDAPPPPPIFSLSFSGDGRYLAAIANNSSAVMVWSTSTGELQFKLDAGQAVTQIAFSPRQNWLATVGGDRQVRVWDVATGRLQGQIQPSGAQPGSGKLAALQFSPDGNWLLTASGKTVQLWRVQTGRLSKTLHHQAIVSSARFREGNEEIVTVSGDGFTRLWQAATGRLRQAFLYRDRANSSVSNPNEQVLLSENGQLLAVMDGKRRVWLWRVGSGQLMRRLEPKSRLPELAGQTIAFSPDNQRIVMTSSVFGKNGSVYLARIWDVQTGVITGELRGHTDPIRTVAFSWDSSLVATASTDGTARLWATERGSEFPSLRMAGRPMQWAILQDAVIGIASDGRLQRWNLLQFPTVHQERESSIPGAIASTAEANSVPLKQLLPADTVLTAVGFHQPDRLLATADSNGTVNLWRVEPDWTVRRVRQLAAVVQSPANNQTVSGANGQIIQHLAWSPDAQLLLGVGMNWIIYVWDANTGKLMSQLQGHTGAIAQAQFSPDGQRIVSASQDHTVRVWQASSGKLLGNFQHESTVNSAYFSPNGQRIITASSDGIARVMDAANGEMRVILAGHRGAVMDARFSPDGNLLATASVDGTTKLWDAHTGVEKALLRPPESSEQNSSMWQTFFSPNGQYLASLSQDGRLYLWAATWTDLLRLARDRSVRQLQPEECLQYMRLLPDACPMLEMKAGG